MILSSPSPTTSPLTTVNDMATRIDNLETGIADVMRGDEPTPAKK